MAFSERIKLIIDVATGGATGPLSQLRTDLSNADGAFAKTKVAAGGLWDGIKANAAPAMLAAGTAITGFAIKAVGDFQETALGAGHLRDSLGVTADEASRLQEVAGDLGIGVDTIEKAIGRMNRTAETSPKKFDELGAAIARNKDGTVDTTQTFLNVIDALNGIKDPAERAARAQEILGRSWQDASELIAMGADGVKEAMAGVENAKIIDDNEIQKARDFRDTLDNLRGIIESVSIEVGNELVPVLTDAAEGLQAIIPLLTGARDAFGSFEDAVKGTPLAGQIYENIAPWEQWRTRIGQVKDVLGVFGIGADDAGASAEEAAAAVDGYTSAFSSAFDAAVKLTQEQANLASETDDSRSAAELLRDAVEHEADRFDDAAEAADRQREAIRKAREETERAAGSAHELERAELDVENAMSDLAQQTSETALVQMDAKRTADEKAQSARDLRQTELDAADAAFQLAQKMADESGAVQGSKQHTDNMRDALQQQADKYPELRDEIQAYIDKLHLIPTQVNTTITNTIRTVGGGTSTTFIDPTTGVARRQGGGTIGMGENATLVGENGPEIVRLPAGAHVYRNSETREMASSRPSINVVVNNNGRDLTDGDIARAIRMVQLAS